MIVKGLKRIQDFVASDLYRKFNVPVKDIKALKRLEEVDLPDETAQIFLGNAWVNAVIVPQSTPKIRVHKKKVTVDSEKRLINDKNKE